LNFLSILRFTQNDLDGSALSKLGQMHIFYKGLLGQFTNMSLTQSC